MDNFSRWLYVYPCYRDRAIDAVTGLKNFILEYGIPKKIGSDRGCHFINELFSNFCDQFHISHNIHAAYRPQSSGQLERVHRTLKTPSGYYVTIKMPTGKICSRMQDALTTLTTITL